MRKIIIYLLSILIISILAVAWGAFWIVDELWNRDHKLPPFQEAIQNPWRDLTNK